MDGRGVRRHFLRAVAWCALASAGGEAAAQAVDPEAQRARELVERVRRSMRTLDELLGGSAPTESTARDGSWRALDARLAAADAQASDVIARFDELIELARQREEPEEPMRLKPPLGGG